MTQIRWRQERLIRLYTRRDGISVWSRPILLAPQLVAHLDVEVEVDGGLISVSAQEAGRAECKEPWRLVNDNYSGYDM